MTAPIGADWSKAQRASRPGPCRYRCGRPAWLLEPGGNQVAHKACADKAAGVAETTVTPAAELEDGKAEPRSVGCGPVKESGRSCGQQGTAPSCMLCPLSPTYWRTTLAPDERRALPPYTGPVVTAEVDNAVL